MAGNGLIADSLFIGYKHHLLYLGIMSVEQGIYELVQLIVNAEVSDDKERYVIRISTVFEHVDVNHKLFKSYAALIEKYPESFSVFGIGVGREGQPTVITLAGKPVYLG